MGTTSCFEQSCEPDSSEVCECSMEVYGSLPHKNRGLAEVVFGCE